MQKVNKQVKNDAMQYEYMYTIITCTLHIKQHIHVNAHLCTINMHYYQTTCTPVYAIQMYSTQLPCSV